MICFFGARVISTNWWHVRQLLSYRRPGISVCFELLPTYFSPYVDLVILSPPQTRARMTVGHTHIVRPDCTLVRPSLMSFEHRFGTQACRLPSTRTDIFLSFASFLLFAPQLCKSIVLLVPGRRQCLPRASDFAVGIAAQDQAKLAPQLTSHPFLKSGLANEAWRIGGIKSRCTAWTCNCVCTRMST